MPRRFYPYQAGCCSFPAHGTYPLSQVFLCLAVLFFLFSGLSIDAYNEVLQHGYFAESLDPSLIDSDEDASYSCFSLAANPTWQGICLFLLTRSLNFKNSLPILSEAKFCLWISRAPPLVS